MPFYEMLVLVVIWGVVWAIAMRVLAYLLDRFSFGSPFELDKAWRKDYKELWDTAMDVSEYTTHEVGCSQTIFSDIEGECECGLKYKILALEYLGYPVEDED